MSDTMRQVSEFSWFVDPASLADCDREPARHRREGAAGPCPECAAFRARAEAAEQRAGRAEAERDAALAEHQVAVAVAQHAKESHAAAWAEVARLREIVEEVVNGVIGHVTAPGAARCECLGCRARRALGARP